MANSADGKRVTLREVAQSAGVSTTTASLVFQAKGQISETTRERVLQAAKSMGYETRTRSQSAATPRGRAVYLIVDDVANPYFQELYGSLHAALHKKGFLVSMASSQDSVRFQRQLLADAGSVGAAAVVLASASGTKLSDVQGALPQDTPLVMAVRNPGFSDFSFVGANPMMGMMTATEHLISLGHKRIAFVGGNRRNAAFSERYAGFISTMTSHGLEVNPQYIASGHTTIAFGREKTLQLCEREDRPTAIIGYNDVVAIGVLRALGELGLKPGKEIAVVGYDDIEESGDSSVNLTTISTPAALLGRIVADEVVRQISSTDRHPISMALPPTLVVRESSGRAG